MNTLGSSLNYSPQELQFGTSGRRGAVADLTQLEIFVNALAELRYLQSLPLEEGGILAGDRFYFGYDLRPSSSRFVAAQHGRGELAQAVVEAIREAGMQPVNLGQIPTPALTYFALSQGKGSMMITGSHIPFDRNGYKTNTSRGELLKKHEQPINEKVKAVRAAIYAEPAGESRFDPSGLFKSGSIPLPAESDAAAEAYRRRYLDFFGRDVLVGSRLLVYQHSAVGRDLLASILAELGAEVVCVGRSETFVPIDTENIDQAQLATIQSLHDSAVEQHGPVDAVVSTDGDSDRPLILGIDDGAVRFFGGDLVGMITAEFLSAGAVVVPISCNDAIDRGRLREITEPKTRIGSPFVIAGMEAAAAKGCRAVCGWEANGGFLTGSDIEKDGKVLRALPTRDAVLPILAVLVAAKTRELMLTELFAELPKRFSRAALIKEFPRQRSLRILRGVSPEDPGIREVTYQGEEAMLVDEAGVSHPAPQEHLPAMSAIKRTLGGFFGSADGFAEIGRINYVDGVRIHFANGDVAHLRPSGNADELRIYAVADQQARADAIASLAVAEPNGILRRMEKAMC